MSLETAVAGRNAMLDALEVEIGPDAVLKIRTGAPPGIGNADSGTVLVPIQLPTNYMAAAAAGSKAKSGTWEGTATAAGTAGHFRLYASDGTTQYQEGTVSAAGSGGKLVLLVNGVPGDSIAIGDVVAIDVFFWDV